LLQESGRHVAVATVVAGAAQDHHPAPVAGPQVDRRQRHRQSGPLHQHVDGIAGPLVHPARLGGGDDRNHSCSPTATAITRAEVSVWVMVTWTSVTPSISA